MFERLFKCAGCKNWRNCSESYCVFEFSLIELIKWRTEKILLGIYHIFKGFWGVIKKILGIRS